VTREKKGKKKKRGHSLMLKRGKKGNPTYSPSGEAGKRAGRSGGKKEKKGEPAKDLSHFSGCPSARRGKIPRKKGKGGGGHSLREQKEFLLAPRTERPSREGEKGKQYCGDVWMRKKRGGKALLYRRPRPNAARNKKKKGIKCDFGQEEKRGSPTSPPQKKGKEDKTGSERKKTGGKNTLYLPSTAVDKEKVSLSQRGDICNPFRPVGGRGERGNMSALGAGACSVSRKGRPEIKEPSAAGEVMSKVLFGGKGREFISELSSGKNV